jgi:hypothetical protein
MKKLPKAQDLGWRNGIHLITGGGWRSSYTMSRNTLMQALYKVICKLYVPWYFGSRVFAVDVADVNKERKVAISKH